VRRLAVASLVLAALPGCASTQEKSARLARAARDRPREHGVKVTKANPDVKVLATHVVHDRYGTAAVVELRSLAAKAQAALPVSIVVTGAGGRKEFANDAAGLAPTLTHVSLLAPRAHVFWVNDQVIADSPRGVDARVGAPTTRVPVHAPRVVVTGRLRLEHDPDGAYTRGRVANDSAVAQRQLVLYAVAQRGGKVVAAGRAGIERLPSHKTREFKVFWIGNPAGAKVSVFAPPTVLEEDGS
jgi:hypothetical protein